MKRICLLILIVLACSVLLPRTQQAQTSIKPNAPAVKPLVLYDDFNGRWIDPAKWEEWMQPGITYEMAREFFPAYQGEGNNRRLRIFERSYARGDNDYDISYGWLGLKFVNGGSINEVVFDVQVGSAALAGCQSNPASGSVEAQFRALFFNTYGNGWDGGNVEAAIGVARWGTDATAPLQVIAYYYSYDGTAYDFRNVGYVRLGQTAKLRFKWDQPNHRFVAQLNKDPEVYMEYSIPDVYPPTWHFRGLQVTHGTPNCTTTPMGMATMDAYFDNVYVNAP